MKIAVVEDDQFIAQEIESYFKLKNRVVTLFFDGLDFLNDDRVGSFDIILLDINIPKMDGIDTFKELREFNIDTPVIFLTSVSDIDCIKKAYSLGCNDYIRKPFYFEELEIKIDKILGISNKCIEIDSEYSFDLDLLVLKFNKKEVEINEKERRLLYQLIKNRGNSVSSEVLIDYVWDDKFINKNTLRTQIRKLRAKVKNDFIKNIRGFGYKIE